MAIACVPHIALSGVVLGGAGDIAGAVFTAQQSSLIRVTVQVTAGVKLGVVITRGSTALTEGFLNANAVLVAAAVHYELFGVERDDVVQFRLSGAATVSRLDVHELKGGVA